MTSKIIKIKCQGYLVQFLQSLYGKQPIIFPEISRIPRAIDHVSYKLLPFDNRQEEYDEESLCIEILPKENGRLNTFYHLRPVAEKIFSEWLNRFFEEIIRSDIDKLLSTKKLKRKDIVTILMERYGISGDLKAVFLSIYNRKRKSEWKKRSLKNKK